MRFHFQLDGLSSQHQETLMTMEAAMTPRSAFAIFEIKSCGLKAVRDLEGAQAFLKTKLSQCHMSALEDLLKVTEMDLASLTKAVKNVPIAMTKRTPVAG